jgi:hypothetical protein
VLQDHQIQAIATGLHLQDPAHIMAHLQATLTAPLLLIVMALLTEVVMALLMEVVMALLKEVVMALLMELVKELVQVARMVHHPCHQARATASHQRPQVTLTDHLRQLPQLQVKIMAHPNLHLAATTELLLVDLLAPPVDLLAPLVDLLAPLLDLPLVVEALEMARITPALAIHMARRCKVLQSQLFLTGHLAHLMDHLPLHLVLPTVLLPRALAQTTDLLHLAKVETSDLPPLHQAETTGLLLQLPVQTMDHLLRHQH